MPLLCFDLFAGRSENQIKRILDVTHEVMVNAFNVPERDRYQIVSPPSHSSEGTRHLEHTSRWAPRYGRKAILQLRLPLPPDILKS